MDAPLNIIWFPRVLVIGPGGVKGHKVLGFLAPIEDVKLLKYTDTYCGVSVGAIISLLVVAGFEIREIIREATLFDMIKELEDFDFNQIKEHNGLISNEPVRKKLSQLITDKLGEIPTLYNLYTRTGKAYISVTYNVTDEKYECMGPFTHPNISCVDATMFSMNIPFLFYQMISHGKIFIDGAFGNPYPIDYFDNGQTDILGIYMQTIKFKPNNETTPRPIIQKLEDIIQPMPPATYAIKILYALIDQRRNYIIHKSSSRCKHVCLQSYPFNAVGYGLTIDDKTKMIVEGYNEGKIFVSQLQNKVDIPIPISPHSQYTYPPHYLYEENNEINLNILDHMNNTN
jgi:predicted acylesterase/phospholipase RssA